MTQVRNRRGRDRDVRTSRRRNRYLELLRAPGALAFSAAGFVGRMSMSMYGLGTVLLIALLTGRYGQAGTVAAAGSVGYAVFGPVIATRADRLGQRRVLVAQSAVFTLSSTVFIACAELRAPFWTLLLTSIAAGGSMPSTGSMVRTRWSSVLRGDPRRLHTAFALESVNDELIFVIGPALVTVLATQLTPASGIGAASLLCIVGTLLFAAQRGTEPAPVPKPLAAGAPVAGGFAATAVTAAGSRGAGVRGAGVRGGLRRGIRSLSAASLPARGIATLAPAFLLIGAMFSGIDLSTVAFATELGHRPVAGLILGTYALGSAVGGLWYGSRHWRAPLGRRFTVTAALAVVGVSTFWAMPGLLALDAVGFLAGLAISPTLMTGYGILERQAPPHRTTEALAWLGSTISVGVALGSAFAGHIIDAHGARWSFVFSAGCGAAGVLICVAGLRGLRTENDDQVLGS